LKLLRSIIHFDYKSKLELEKQMNEFYIQTNEVKTYTLTPEELEHYKSLPVPKKKKQQSYWFDYKKRGGNH